MIDKKNVLDVLYIAKAEFANLVDWAEKNEKVKMAPYEKSWMVIDKIIRDIVEIKEL